MVDERPGQGFIGLVLFIQPCDLETDPTAEHPMLGL